MRYKIIDTLIDIRLNPDLEQIWHPFLTEDLSEKIKIDLSMYPQPCYGMDVLNIKNMSHALRNESGVLFANSDWTYGRMYAGETDEIAALTVMQLYSYLVARQTLMIHSSQVDYNGEGIMFLGPSGIGKTTQAELWNKYQNAEILNGDMVFVRKNEDGFYGYGSPWHGSSVYYKNAKVKLKAMIVLEQAPENVLRRLDGFELLQGMMEQVFLPHWYMETMETCLDTLDKLLEEVPLYHLACRPDEDAVLLVKNELNM